MSGKKYVPEGVYLVCDKGTKPSELRSLSSKKTTIFGENMCTQIDTKLVVNFDPFGACSCANGNPCTAPVTGWTNVTDAITLGGNKLLLENSELPCALGGKVKIFFTMAAAMAAMPKPKKSFWRRYADTVVDISDWVLRAEKGLAIGVWKALKGTVTGIVDLVVWAGKHTHTYQMLNPKGYAEQIQKDVETFKALGNVAKKAGTWLYRNSDINKAINPQDYILAQQENAEMLDKMIEKASKMKVEEVTEFIGQVGFEIVLDVATVGGAAALTAVKAADKTLDAVKVINAVDNTTDAVKVLDKTEDLADGAKALDKINDGNKIDLPPIETKVLEDVKYLDEVIELKGGKKGKGWNKELNGDLKPNSKYSVDGYLYETDELGRVKKASGKLKLKERGRNNYQQGKSVKAKDGIDGDQGGHLIGDRFYGPGEQINYVPQKGSLNQSAYKKMENDWAKALKEGKEVDVNIENIYDGVSKRPIGQEVNYKIGDKDYVKIFEN